MDHDAILQISGAEESARSTLQKAQAEARERVTAAQNAAERLLSETRRNLAGESADAAAQEQKKAELYAAERLEEANRECDSLRRQAESNMDAAVVRIMERVMN